MPGTVLDRYFGKLYGELYREHLLEPDRAKREVDLAARILKLKDARVLDLAAGFGRHARILAKSNEVWALDTNADYLRTAKRGLSGIAARNLRVAQADMRMLPFADARFDAAILLFNSFGYFAPLSDSANDSVKRPMWKLPRVYYERQIVAENFGESNTGDGSAIRPAAAVDRPLADENETVLLELARVLKRGGGLLLEIPNPAPLLAAVRDAPKRRVSTAQYEIEEEFSFDPAARVLSNRTCFRMDDREERGGYALRLYERKEITTMLRTAGFVVKSVFGDYEGGPHSARRSEMILVSAVRR